MPDKTEGPADNYYKQVVSRLRAAGADLFLVGHSHTYARTYPLLGQVDGTATYVLDTDGDYAKGSGLVQLVVGVGGAELREGDFNAFPFVAAGFSTTTARPVQNGFVHVNVSSSRLTFRYTSVTGEVLDTFAISEVTTNLAPIAEPQGITMSEDNSKAITLTAIDVNNDPLRYVIVSAPAHGTITGTAPNLSYRPAANFFGTDSFRFKANDGVLDSVPATVSITIKPINDRPVAKSFSVSTVANTPIKTRLSGTDVDGDPLTFFVTTPPTVGILTGTAPDLTYTPKAGFIGTDSFKYQASDGKLSSKTATVTVKVIAGVATSTVSFQDGVFPFVSYSGTEDTKIRSDLPTSVLGASRTLELDGNPDMASLIKWNISQIPPGSTVRSAAITINVISNSSNGFDIYELLRPWKETTATFNLFDSGQAWSIVGASGSSDRGGQILGTLAAANFGLFTVSLNSSAMAVLQKWIDNPDCNFGLIFQNYSDTASNDVKFTSSEGTTANLRPKLTIEYSLPTSVVTTSALRTSAVLTNPVNPYDVNSDGTVTHTDALVVINKLNNTGSHAEENLTQADQSYPDVSGDDLISPLDVLLVFNYLNQFRDSQVEGEADEFQLAGILLPADLLRGHGGRRELDRSLSPWSDRKEAKYFAGSPNIPILGSPIEQLEEGFEDY